MFVQWFALRSYAHVSLAPRNGAPNRIARPDSGSYAIAPERPGGGASGGLMFVQVSAWGLYVQVSGLAAPYVPAIEEDPIRPRIVDRQVTLAGGGTVEPLHPGPLIVVEVVCPGLVAQPAVPSAEQDE